MNMSITVSGIPHRLTNKHGLEFSQQYRYLQRLFQSHVFRLSFRGRTEDCPVQGSGIQTGAKLKAAVNDRGK
jgi:hypothetical protein